MSETDRLLNEIRIYIRISAAAASRVTARSVIDTYEKAIVYSKLDGKTSQTKIEADTKVPQTTVSGWLAEFMQVGLVAPSDKYNPSHKALFTLQELGIDFGVLKRREKASKAVSQSPAPTRPQQGDIQKTLESEKSGASNQ